MSNRLPGVLADPALVAGGWMLLVVFWETLLAGVLFAAWRVCRPRTSARTQHAVATGAFLLTLTFALATPLLLRSLPAEQRLVPASQAAPVSWPTVTDSRAGAPAGTGAALLPGGRLTLDDFAAVGALGWIVGVFALSVRLVAGIVGVLRLRRRAVRLTDGTLHDLATGMQADLGLRQTVAVLASKDVQAPAVVGWWRPALLVPVDRLRGLSPEMTAGLCAHELAHVRRRDYLANLLQSFAETLLFFSPAVRWIGRCIRETREYCCDDEAMRRCLDPVEYVRALAALASNGAIPQHRTALGAAGPRLAARVRRLLAAEPAPRFTGARLLACALGLLALAISGTHVAFASAARTARFDALRTQLGVPPYPPVPYSFASEQDGTGIEMSALVSTLDSPVREVTIRNTGSVRVTGLRFAAAVEMMPSRRRPLLLPVPVRLFLSDMQPVSIEPGQVSVISPQVLAGRDLQSIVSDAHGAHVQFMLAVAAVQYVESPEWRLTLNPLATSADDALGIGRPSIPRLLLTAGSLIERWEARIVSALQPRNLGPSTVASIPRSMVADESVPTVNSHVCRDDLDRAFSPGASVAIRNEPGRRAVCRDGQWIETAGR